MDGLSLARQAREGRPAGAFRRSVVPRANCDLSDLPCGHEAASNGFGEIPEISIGCFEKAPEIRRVPDVRRTSWLQRRAVIAERQYLMTRTEKRASEATEIRELGPFGAKTDPIKAQRSSYARLRKRKEAGAKRSCEPGEAARHGELKQPEPRPEPEGTVRPAAEIGSAIGGIVEMRRHARVDLVPELVEEVRRRGADAVA